MNLEFEQLTRHPVTEVPLERGTRRSRQERARGGDRRPQPNSVLRCAT